MLGVGELLVIGGLMLLFGGGSAAGLVATLRRSAVAKATGTLRSHVDELVPDELKEVAGTVKKLQRGDVGGLMGLEGERKE